MPLKVIKTADEWRDLDRTLRAYENLMNSLRENASKQVHKILDDIESRADAGEDFESLINEYSAKNKSFGEWVDEKSPSENGSDSGGHTKGDEISGLDSDGNKVSGTYIRSVFGRPQIETSNGPVVLSEIE